MKEQRLSCGIPVDFCIEVEHKKFNIQLYNKEGYFSFLICRMPLLGSNFPSEILYSTFEADTFQQLLERVYLCQTFCKTSET